MPFYCSLVHLSFRTEYLVKNIKVQRHKFMLVIILELGHKTPCIIFANNSSKLIFPLFLPGSYKNRTRLLLLKENPITTMSSLNNGNKTLKICLLKGAHRKSTCYPYNSYVYFMHIWLKLLSVQNNLWDCLLALFGVCLFCLPYQCLSITGILIEWARQSFSHLNLLAKEDKMVLTYLYIYFTFEKYNNLCHSCNNLYLVH